MTRSTTVGAREAAIRWIMISLSEEDWKHRAARLEPVAQLREIHQVAIVRDCDSAARILNHQRLAVLDSS